MNSLPDVQNTKIKSISINRVGVTDVDFPVKIYDKLGKEQIVCAKVNLYGSLPKTQRGTNMSRFIEVLMKFKDKPLSGFGLKNMLQELIKVVETKDMYAEIEFKYFIEKVSPVKKKKGMLAYRCALIGHLNYLVYTHVLKIVVPVTSVCPCSKKMSKVGAHNQRGEVTVQLVFEKDKSILIEDIVALIEEQGSCELYSILKREDEKYVTERAYKHAKFVEDIARDVALALQEKKEIKKFKVKVENYESIHDHNAVAYMFRKRKGIKWVPDSGEF